PTSAQRFTLVSLPGLIGSFMRFPYTFAVPRFGGRNWTVVSALLLLIPTVSLVVLVRHPETPFWLMALAASTAGLGGGNFASSMANISFFYPDRKKGFALGLNAAGGNIGVSTVQLLVPIVIGIGAAKGSPRLENAGLMWLRLIVVSAMGAATLAVVYFVDHRIFAGFLFAFLVLFIASGIGNGSTFRMIPAIFRAEKLRRVNGGGEDAVAAAMAVARRETAAVLGFSSAVGALGGFFIPRALGASITATGGATPAFGAFFICYIVCVAVTWWYYLRSSFLVGLAPSLAHADA